MKPTKQQREMSAFNWRELPAEFRVDTKPPVGQRVRIAKRDAGLQDPITMQRKGGISITPRDIDSTAKADRLRKAGI